MNPVKSLWVCETGLCQSLGLVVRMPTVPTGPPAFSHLYREGGLRKPVSEHKQIALNLVLSEVWRSAGASTPGSASALSLLQIIWAARRKSLPKQPPPALSFSPQILEGVSFSFTKGL